MQIRPFHSDDEESIVALWRRCDLVRPWNDPHRDIQRTLRVRPDLFLVGVQEGQVVASVMAGYEGHRGWLNYLAIAPELQRRGHARAIVAAAERLLREAGCPKSICRFGLPTTASVSSTVVSTTRWMRSRAWAKDWSMTTEPARLPGAMSKQRENIDSDLAAWISRQRVFFVATAPLSVTGHINVSPKGGESFRILGPLEVAYQDYTGSGAESAAHLRENGRMVVMFCAFEGSPKIVRLHGRGILITPRHSKFAELASFFPAHAGTRAFVHVSVTRVSSSCGYAVPFFEFRGHRDMLDHWTAAQGPEKLEAYRATKNQRSIDGLPAFDRNM